MVIVTFMLIRCFRLSELLFVCKVNMRQLHSGQQQIRSHTQTSQLCSFQAQIDSIGARALCSRWVSGTRGSHATSSAVAIIAHWGHNSRASGAKFNFITCTTRCSLFLCKSSTLLFVFVTFSRSLWLRFCFCFCSHAKTVWGNENLKQRNWMKPRRRKQ